MSTIITILSLPFGINLQLLPPTLLLYYIDPNSRQYWQETGNYANMGWDDKKLEHAF